MNVLKVLRQYHSFKSMLLHRMLCGFLLIIIAIATNYDTFAVMSHSIEEENGKLYFYNNIYIIIILNNIYNDTVIIEILFIIPNTQRGKECMFAFVYSNIGMYVRIYIIVMQIPFEYRSCICDCLYMASLVCFIDYLLF